jgi:hypothetical protein
MEAPEDEGLKRALGPTKMVQEENCMNNNYVTTTMRRVKLLGQKVK